MPFISTCLHKLLVVNGIPGTRQSGLPPDCIYSPLDGTFHDAGRGARITTSWSSLVAQHVRDLAIVAAVTWVHFLAQEIPHAAGMGKTIFIMIPKY